MALSTAWVPLQPELNLRFQPTIETDCVSFFISLILSSDKKYLTLIKNVHFYLCFVSLELGDYTSSIRHGNELLKQFSGKLTPKTEHTVKQYLAEAYCMVGQPKEAQKLL